MVRRQLLVHPRQRAMLGLKCQCIDLVNGQHGGLSFLITLPGNQGSTESTHDTGDIRTDRFAAGNLFKASEYGVIVEGTALYNDVLTKIVGIG